ncbi:MAG: hypothetical protein IIC07_06415 [Proteobacteria bacterium]|nr:hypothetical protein [Pseudomonadota bacterium]
MMRMFEFHCQSPPPAPEDEAKVRAIIEGVVNEYEEYEEYETPLIRREDHSTPS